MRSQLAKALEINFHGLDRMLEAMVQQYQGQQAIRLEAIATSNKKLLVARCLTWTGCWKPLCSNIHNL